MTYTKPEVNHLGTAVQLIQLVGKLDELLFEPIPPFGSDPAYDLDE